MDAEKRMLINATVKTALEMVTRDRKDFERLASSEISQWSSEDSYMARGAILSLLAIARGNMVRYLGDEDSLEPTEEERAEFRSSPRRSETLKAVMDKVELISTAARKQAWEDLLPGERAVLSAASLAFLMVVEDGTVTY